MTIYFIELLTAAGVFVPSAAAFSADAAAEAAEARREAEGAKGYTITTLEVVDPENAS